MMASTPRAALTELLTRATSAGLRDNLSALVLDVIPGVPRE